MPTYNRRIARNLESFLSDKRIEFMKDLASLLRAGKRFVFLVIFFFICGCAGSPSVLDPGGPKAQQVAGLTWLIFGLGTVIFVVVAIIFGLALVRASRRSGPLPAEPAGHRMILIGGIVLPAVLLTGLMGITVRTGLELERVREDEALVVEVTGWQYWWEVRYPQHDVLTANEIHIPTGRTVELRLTSVDVIHSFWVPQIAYKVDMIPGQTNALKIEASEPGRYRGQCAEFCGIQHAKMALHLVAESPQSFASWVDQMSEPASAAGGPLVERGRAIFMARACSACHGIQGTEARGTAAPDLTHLMRREYLAAGTVLNTPENLASFITRAQALKQGSSMPSFTDLDQDSLAALIAFLTSLE